MEKLFVIVVILISACASGPRNMKEMHPVLPARDGDPRVGLIILEGEPAVNIEFFDKAGRSILKWDEAGKDPLTPKYNGQRRPRLYKEDRLDHGNYQAKIQAFYYATYFEFPNPLPKRRLVELPVQNSFVSVDRRVDFYDGRYTGRHWGWILRIDTGDIPRGHYSGPQVNVSGTGLPGVLLDWLTGGKK